MRELEIVIGLEIHAQLMTQSKAFCPAPSSFGAEENSSIGPVSAGFPGALPILNEKAVELAVRAGHCLNCSIQERSVFERKNYFYPDLPKGYQISQYQLPLCTGGWLEIELNTNQTKKIALERIHMEEDAGKSSHYSTNSLLNLNRSGVPLIEIVTKPEITSSQEAVAFLKKLRALLTFAKVTDGNMEEGNFRCDVNLSVRPVGTTTLGTRTEIKNLNSFRFIEKAIAFESARHMALVQSGSHVTQETRGWDAALDKTFSLRSKEDAHDYRYFPDPDLPPLILTQDKIKDICAHTPELPEVKIKRYQERFGLGMYDAQQLTSSAHLASYFEACIEAGAPAKPAANWILSEVLSKTPSEKIDDHFKISLEPKHLAELILLIEEKIVSGKMAKEIFQTIYDSNHSPRLYVKTHGLSQVSDPEQIQKWAVEVVSANPQVVQEFLSGKERVLSHLVGKVMQLSKGKANPTQVTEAIRKVVHKQ